MNRGDPREPIFKDDTDRQRFVETLGKACVKSGWQVHAYCLMPKVKIAHGYGRRRWWVLRQGLNQACPGKLSTASCFGAEEHRQQEHE